MVADFPAFPLPFGAPDPDRVDRGVPGDDSCDDDLPLLLAGVLCRDDDDPPDEFGVRIFALSSDFTSLWRNLHLFP